MSLRIATPPHVFAASLWCIATTAEAAEHSEPRRTYNLHRGDAATTLKQFAAISGRQVFFMMDKVRDEQTNAIAGDFTPDEALHRMLAGTQLVALKKDTEEGYVIGRHRAKEKKEVGSQSSTKPQPQPQTMPQQTLPAKIRFWISRAALFVTSIATAQEAANSSDQKAASEETVELPTYVVSTGAFEPVSRQKASIAISIIDSKQMGKIVPTSALDMLNSVPGVWVDSARGEVLNFIVSRGNTFVSVEEDGLPLNGAHSGFTIRADATLDRIEAVRGGSASVTGANAPGGIFNYISKTGGDIFSGEVSINYGLQGNGSLPQFRADFTAGGPLAKGWYYHIGGFYRRGDGTHDAGYTMDYGGQLKANITKTFEKGILQIYAKVLDDHNGLNDSVPAVDFNSPRPAPGFNNTSSGQMPALSFRYQTGPNSFKTFDSTDLTHNRSGYIGVKVEANLGDGWTISNNGRYIRNNLSQNVTSRPYPTPLNDFISYFLMGTFGRPGTYTLTDAATGTSARVLSNSGFDFTVLNSSLPTPKVNNVMGQAADDITIKEEEWIDRLAVTKEFDRMSFTGGVFYRHLYNRNKNRIISFGMSTLTPQPRMLDITLTTPAGQTLQVTNPQGFAAPSGVANVGSNYKLEEVALFLGHRWELSDRWTLDWGVRRADTRQDSDNHASSRSVTVDTTSVGGLDGNPNTLFDNRYVFDGPLVSVGKTLATTSYSAAINREVNESNSVYMRYSVGERTNQDFVTNLNDPATKDITPWIPQTVTQWEVGYKFHKSRYSLGLTAYDSIVKGVGFAILRDTDGSFYPALTPENRTRNYGLEAEGEIYLEHGFALRAALTLQRGTLEHSWTLSQPNGPGPRSTAKETDSNAGNKAPVPDAMFTLTPSYAKGRFYGQIQWKYLGDRPANNGNAFVLPAFSQTDLTMQWELTRRLHLSVTLNNVFNEVGAVEWAPPGNQLVNADAFSRAQLLADPNAVFIMLPIQARAYFLKCVYKF